MIRINLHTKANAKHRGLTFMVTVFVLILLAGSLAHARGTPVIDGVTVDDNAYPAIFAITTTLSPGTTDETAAENLCTAFLVHPRLLLTAAHCLTGITAVATATNGVTVGAGNRLSIATFNPYRTYVTTGPKASRAEALASGAVDIGYVLLSEDAKGIEPIEIIPSTDDASRMKWKDELATVVGYGANVWQKSGVYTPSAGSGTKREGHKPITTVANGLIYLEGATNGILPGDSGGPILLRIDGKLKAVAINHKKSDATKMEAYKPLFSKKVKYREVRDHYEAGIASPLTMTNLCWVEKETQIDIPGVDCTGIAGSKAAP